MTDFSIEVVSASDIHMGHNRTPSRTIIDNWNKMFANEADFSKIQLFFLAGDVFDRLLQMPEEDSYLIRAWAYKFLCKAAKHGVVVRALEGTPRHDRKQTRMFEELIELTGLEVDFKYVDTLSIEHIERFGINVLYVPDEWRHDPQETFEEVKALLADRMLEQVDFACMHGCFEYQLPDVESVRRSSHRSENYLPIVRWQIFIGHHHVFSQFEHIVAQGSFDRLTHGEESPKGCVRLSIRKGVKTLVFVENKTAMDYRTVSVKGLSIEEVNELVRSLQLRDGSRIRFSGGLFDMGLRMLRHIRKDFPQYKFTTQVDKTEDKDTRVNLSTNYTPVQIGHSNVTGMVSSWLLRNATSEADIKECEGFLNEHLRQNAST